MHCQFDFLLVSFKSDFYKNRTYQYPPGRASSHGQMEKRDFTLFCDRIEAIHLCAFIKNDYFIKQTVFIT